jgi:enamine deaminase RidA (YjgF/YER057c/UK114 family)
MTTTMTMTAAKLPVVEHLNPDGLPRNPAFTNVVVVRGPARTVYVGGQDSVDATGAVVGVGDIGAQAEQILRNLRTALAAAGARIEDVVKWNVYVVQGQDPRPAFEAFQRTWGERPNPPAITLAFVSGLAHPDFLMELDAIAVVPDEHAEQHQLPHDVTVRGNGPAAAPAGEQRDRLFPAPDHDADQQERVEQRVA